MLEGENGTWLQAEEFAYPNGGQTRKGMAMYPDGKVRTVYGGIPDTYFSIPAHGRIRGKYVAGALMYNADHVIAFYFNKKYQGIDSIL